MKYPSLVSPVDGSYVGDERLSGMINLGSPYLIRSRAN